VIDPSTLDVIEHRAGTYLGTLNAHRLLLFEVTRGHWQVISGHPDPRRITVEGGWSGLAEAVGARGNRAVEQVRHAVELQAHACCSWPDGTMGTLLSYLHRPARGQEPAVLTLVLNDPLMPGYVHAIEAALGKAPRHSREARRLVPITDLPPFVGRERDWASEASLALRVLVALRLRAREIVERGGALLPRDLLADLAREAGLPRELLDRVIDRWTRDGDDGPAFLEFVDTSRFVLGRAHSPARRFLEMSGRREVTGQDWGRRRQRQNRMKSLGKVGPVVSRGSSRRRGG
jgi:hypothetical protein